jgi:hypothetical protein
MAEHHELMGGKLHVYLPLNDAEIVVRAIDEATQADHRIG